MTRPPPITAHLLTLHVGRVAGVGERLERRAAGAGWLETGGTSPRSGQIEMDGNQSLICI